MSCWNTTWKKEQNNENGVFEVNITFTYKFHFGWVQIVSLRTTDLL
jgi:hypothetical protein